MLQDTACSGPFAESWGGRFLRFDVDSSNRSIERIGSEGSRAVCDHADLLLLRCDDSQDLIDQDHFLAWDELLGLR
ncbi:MAG: hypothetical protein CBD47_00385 [Synechococcus sp. TMED187]|nr:hypothetical protein [Synechococcus sp. NAT40]OUW50456.1 MAG: hypothetical protein CBD47_00385 [Synechococcus sp. TMED187]